MRRPATPCCAAAALLVALAATLGSSASAFATTETFTPAKGSEQPFEVPAGVSQIKVTAIGETGEEGCPEVPGGAGAKVTAVITVEAGQMLYVDFSGGGGAAKNCDYGGKGGDASDVRTKSGGSTQTSLESRLVVAGGGGGGGNYGVGGGGNASGSTGEAGV